MATPSVQSIYQSTYVSAYDIYKEDVLNKVFNRYGYQGEPWFITLDKLGWVKPTSNMNYHHYEGELRNPTFSPRANVGAPGNDTNQLITLSAADVNASNQFYPRPNDLVYYPNGQKGLIISIDVSTPAQPVLNIAPLGASAAYTLPAVTTATVLSIISNAYAEGTDQGRPVLTGAVKFTNNTQIIKEQISATGSELTNETYFKSWVDVTDGAMGAENFTSGGKSWYNLTWTDMEWRQYKNISGSFIFGVKGDGRNTASNGAATRTTEGLLPFITTNGSTQTYTAGSFSPIDMDATGRILDREYAGDRIACLASRPVLNDVDNGLYSYFQNTNIIFAQEQIAREMGREGKGMNVDFSYLKKGDRTYLFRPMMEFTDRQTFGTTGSVTQKYALFIPFNKKIKDAKSGEMMDCIGGRYKALDGYSRKFEIWSISGAGPGMKVSTVDYTQDNIRSDVGAHNMGGNMMILLTS